MSRLGSLQESHIGLYRNYLKHLLTIVIVTFRAGMDPIMFRKVLDGIFTKHAYISPQLFQMA
jgi:hypothetical protein